MQKNLRSRRVCSLLAIPFLFGAVTASAQGLEGGGGGMSALSIALFSTVGVLVLLLALSIFLLVMYRKKYLRFSHKCDDIEPKLEKTGKELGLMKVRFSSALEQHTRLLDESGAALFKLDENGVCMYSNKALETLCGRSREALAGGGLLNAVHPDDRTRVQAAWQEPDPTGAACQLQYRIQCKGGGTVYVEERGAAMLTGDRSVCGYFAVVTDVNEREDALQNALAAGRSSARFIEQTVSGFYELRSDKPISLDQPAGKVAELISRDMKLVSCGESLAAFFGDSSDELIGLPLKNLPGNVGLLGDAHDLQQFVSGGLSFIGVERVGADHRGTPHYLSTDAVGVVEDGKLVCILGAHCDISDRKRDEEKMEQQMAFYRRVLDTLPGDVFVKDPRCRYLYVNRGFEDRTGVPADDWVDKTIFEVLPAAPRDVNAGSIQAMKSGSRSSRVDRRPGSDEWAETVENPLVSEDGVVEGVVGITMDATERVGKERVLQESEARFRYLVENNPVGIMMADETSRQVLYANPVFCDLFGYSEDEVIDLTVGDLHSAGSRRQVLQEWGERARGSRRFDATLACQRKDRSVVYADLGVSAGTLGGAERTIGVYSDAAGRKKIEAGLERQRDYQAGILREAAMVVSTVDLSGMTRSANDMLLELVGMDAPDLVGQPFVSTLVFKEDRALVKKALSPDSPERKEALEFRVVSKPGALLTVRCRIMPRVDEPGFTIAGMDVTALRGEEQKLLSECESLKANVEDRDSHLKSAREALQESKQLCEKLVADIASAEERQAGTIRELNEELDAFRKRETDLNDEVAARSTHEDELSAECERLSGELAEMTAALQTRTDELEAGQSEFDQVRGDLQQRIEQLEKELGERSVELKVTVTGRNDLEQELKQLKKQMQATNESLNDELAQVSAQRQALEDDVQTRRAHEDELSAECERLGGELADATAALQERTAELQERTTELDAAQSEHEQVRDDLLQRVEQLKTSLRERSVELEVSVSGRNNLEETLKQMQAEAKSLNAELVNVSEQCQALEADVKSRSAHENELIAECVRLDSELAEATAALQARADELASGQSEHEQIRDDLQQCVEQLEAALAERSGELEASIAARAAQEEELTQLKAKLQETIESLSAELAQVSGQRQALDEELQRRRAREDELSAECERLGGELAEATAALQVRTDELTAEQGEQEQERGELQQRIEQLEAELKERSGELEASTAARAAQEEGLAQLQAKLHETTESLNGELSQVSEQRQALDDELQARRAHEDELSAECERLGGELEETTAALKARTDELTAQQGEQEQVRADLQQHIEELEVELGRRVTELEAAVASRNEKEQALLALTKQMQEAEDARMVELAQDSKQRKKLDEELQGRRAREDELSAECERLRGELEGAQAELKERADAIEAGKGELNQRLAELDAAHEKEQELAQTKTWLEETVETMRGELTEESEQRWKLDEELKQLRKDAAAGQKELNARVEEKAAGLKQELETLRKREKQLVVEQSRTDQQLAELNDKLMKAADDLKTSRAACRQLQVELEGEKARLAQREEAVEAERAGFEDQVKERTRELTEQLEREQEQERQLKEEQKVLEARLDELKKVLESRDEDVKRLHEIRTRLEDQVTMEKENFACRSQLFKEEMQDVRKAQQEWKEREEDLKEELEDIKNSLARQEREAARQSEARQRAEQETERIRSAFEADGFKVYGLAKDLSEPLEPVVALSGDVLEEGELPESAQGRLEQIHTCGRRMQAIIHYQQEVFRMDHEGIGQDPQPVELNRFLTGMTDDYTGKAGRKQLFFALSRANDLPHTACVDPTGIHRVLDSLFDYALERAGRKDRMGIHVTCESVGEGRRMLVFLLVFSSLEGSVVVTSGLFDPDGCDKAGRDMSDEELELALTCRYATMMGGRLCLQASSAPVKRLSFSVPIDLEPAPAAERSVDSAAEAEEEKEIAWL